MVFKIQFNSTDIYLAPMLGSEDVQQCNRHVSFHSGEQSLVMHFAILN